MPITPEGWWVIAVTAVFLVLLVTERASHAALGVGLIVVLPLIGVIDGSTAVAGFANKAVVTIAGLYVVGAGLTRTGAVEFLGQFLTRAGSGSERRIVLLTCLAGAVLSAFINDTAVVVVFIPIILRIASEQGVPASRLLMPVSFASLLGGMCTLIGTSTNLLVSGMAEELGAQPLKMFDLAPVGIPMALACIAFLALFSKHLLPSRNSLSAMMTGTTSREYVTEFGIGEDSPLIGREVADLTEDMPVTLLFVVRDGIMQPAARFTGVLALGDILVLRGGVEEILSAQSESKLEQLHGAKLDPHAIELFEVALAPGSTWLGHRVKELEVHERYGAMAMAILRGGHHMNERVADMAIEAGDVLLLCGDETSRARLRASSDFFLLAGEPAKGELKRRARRALLVAGAVVFLLSANALLGLKQIPPSSAALIGALAMVATGCVDGRRAFRSIDWSILVFIAGTLALGEAMRVSKVAEAAAALMVDGLAGWGVPAVVGGLVLLGFGFNFLVSHSAVAVLFTPVAVAAAARMAAEQGLLVGSEGARAIEHALMLAVCYGGSMCFATPVAHQVNLMVLGPGDYRYRDFLRLGIPVSLIAMTVAILGIPLVTGLD